MTSLAQLSDVQIRYASNVAQAAAADARAMRDLGVSVVETDTRVTRAAKSAQALANQYDADARLTAKTAEVKRRYAADLAALEARVISGEIAEERAAEMRTSLAAMEAAAIAKVIDAQERWLAARQATTAAANDTAYHDMATGVSQVAAANENLGHSTKLASCEITNLSYQLQDAVTQLVGGQSPFLILMQQGPQAAMAVGGFGRALSLLLSPTVLIVAAIAAVAAGIGTLIGRAVAAGAEVRRLDTTLSALNPTLAGSAQLLRDLSFDVADRGASRGEAFAALTAAVSDARVQSVGLAAAIARVSVDIAAIKGGNPSDWAKKLSDAAAGGAVGFGELADELPVISSETLAAARAADLHGDRLRAVKLVVGDLEAGFGGSAKKMRSSWGDMTFEMARAWDNFAEQASKFPGVSLIVDGWAARFREIADALDPRKGAANTIAATETRIAGLRDELAGLSAWPGLDTPLRRDDLTEKIAAETRRLADLKRQAAVATNGIDGSIPGVTPAEKSRLDTSSEALDRYAIAMRGTAAARQIAVAGQSAYEAAIAAKKTEEVAQIERLQAERRARIDMAAAVSDQDAQLTASARAALDAGRAWASSFEPGIVANDRMVMGVRSYIGATSAALEADARSRAETDALTEAVDVAARTRQYEVEATAKQYATSAQASAAMEDEVDWTLKIAAATKEGIAARTEMERLYEVHKSTSEIYAAARVAEAAGDKRLAENLKDLADRYGEMSKAKRSAGLIDNAAKYSAELSYQAETLRLQASIVGTSDENQTLVGAYQKITDQLHAQGRTWDSLNDMERESYQNLVRQQAQYDLNTLAVERQKDAWKQVWDIPNNAIDRLTDGIVQAFASGSDAAVKWGDILKSITASVVSDFAKLAVVDLKRLIGIPTGTSGGLSDLFGSSVGGQSSAAAVSIGGVSYVPTTSAGAAAQNPLGVNTGTGGIGGLGSQFSWWNKTPFGGTTQINQGVPYGSAGGSGSVVAQPGWLNPSWGQLLTGGLSTAYGAYQLATAKTAGGYVSGGIGAASGLASILGLGGSWLGPLGAVGGTLIGSLVDSLFPDKPSDKYGQATLNLSNGSIVIGGQSGEKYSAANREAANGLAQSAYTITKALNAASTGKAVAGSLQMTVGDRDGTRYSWDGGGEVRFEKNDTAGLLRRLTSDMATSLGDGLTGVMKMVITRIASDTSADAETIVKDIGFAANFDEYVKTAQDYGTVLGAINDAMKSGKDAGDSFANTWIDFLDQTAKVFSTTSTTSLPGYATGTLSASPGLHVVGEEGPEVVRLAGGERIWTARESAAMLAGMGVGGDRRLIHVNDNEIPVIRRALGNPGGINPATGLLGFDPSYAGAGMSGGSESYGGSYSPSTFSSSGSSWSSLTGALNSIGESLSAGMRSLTSAFEDPSNKYGYGAGYGPGTASPYTLGATLSPTETKSFLSALTSSSGYGGNQGISDIANSVGAGFVLSGGGMIGQLGREIGRSMGAYAAMSVDDGGNLTIRDNLSPTRLIGGILPGGSLLTFAANAAGLNDWVSGAESPAARAAIQMATAQIGKSSGGSYTLKSADVAGLSGPEITAVVAAVTSALAARHDLIANAVAAAGIDASTYGHLSSLADQAAGTGAVNIEGYDPRTLLAQVNALASALASLGAEVPETVTALTKELEALSAARQAFDQNVASGNQTSDATDMEKAVASARGYWSEQEVLARRVGYTAEQASSKIAEGLANNIAALASDYGKSLDALINTANGKDYLNTINTLMDERSARERDLAALGMSASRATEVFNAQVSALLKTLNAEEMADVVEHYGSALGDLRGALTSEVSTIRSWLDAQVIGDTSTLAPGGRLAEAQRQFADALGGFDAEAVTSLASTITTLSKDLYGGTAQGAALTDWTRSQVSEFGARLGGYANGGVSTYPQLAWVSEGAYAAEAHVPLPNGDSIPVVFSGPTPSAASVKSEGGLTRADVANLTQAVMEMTAAVNALRSDGVASAETTRKLTKTVNGLLNTLAAA